MSASIFDRHLDTAPKEGSIERQMILDSAEKFLNRHIAPVGAAQPAGPMARDHAASLLASLAPYGFLGTLVPERDGGTGLDFETTLMLYEALFRAHSGLGCIAFCGEVVGLSIHRDGTQWQKDTYLPGILSGRLLTAQAATEPAVGSNPRDIAMCARADGDGFVLNGRKIWITNGINADIIIVLTKDEGDRLCRFIVPADTPGLDRKALPTMGHETWGTAELGFENVRLPATAMLGQPGSGNRQVLQDFAVARCFVSASALATAQAAFDLAVAYARERRQWGKLIGEHQLVQEMVADSALDLALGRMMAHRAAAQIMEDGHGGSLPAMAKLFTSEAAVRVTSNAMQIFGGLGLSRDMPLERLFRDARMFPIPDGTSQIQKLIIAREVLGLSAFA